MLFSRTSNDRTAPEDTLSDRPGAMPITERHVVLGTSIEPPFPEGTETTIFGMGCFWGAERLFWQLPGVFTTAVGYAGGTTPNPSYEETCSGSTGHTEVVLIAYDPTQISYDDLLKTFWEGHDPTQGMRQGNDRGSQYRSALYWTTDAQQEAALASRARYAMALAGAGHGSAITTELAKAGAFYYAETYHQQYLARNPRGYCGIGGTGVSCPVGTAVTG
ncbi:MAG: peptide-methionine (S)-S-oxide reductase MsrA [Thermoleophilia bacterium]